MYHSVPSNLIDRPNHLTCQFKKAYDSISSVLYNILKEFGVHTKLVGIIKMCLYESYSKVRIGKYLSDNFHIQNGLKQGEALSPLLFNFALEYTISKVQENQVRLKLNETHQLLVHADDMILLGDARLPASLSIYLSIYLSMALQSFASPWSLFRFLILYTVDRAPCTGD
jgi:hypothetical protein